jgi:hypothetical protein
MNQAKPWHKWSVIFVKKGVPNWYYINGETIHQWKDLSQLKWN